MSEPPKKKLILKRKAPKNEVIVEPPQKPEPVEVAMCPICADPYTSVVRKEVECNRCHEKACLRCVETYMCSGIEDPHCMHCRTTWTRTFLNGICSNAFLNKTYFAHRQTVLLNREKSFLPTYQVVAEREIKARALGKEDIALAAKQREIEIEMQKRIAVIHGERSALWRRIRNVREGRDENATSTATKAVASKFIRRCTAPECNGFLSTAWKCGLCGTWACPDCFEIKGLNKDAPHTCTAEALATAELIRKDTKPCPTCGEMISKIDGCFAKDTPIRYLDGRIGMSQDVRIGDVLLGDDGRGRTVIATVTGQDEMFKIHQSNAMSYTVNSKHLLALKNSRSGRIEEIYTDVYVKLMRSAAEDLKGYNIDSTKFLATIRIESIGQGTYYGFTVDTQDGTLSRRFALEDGTVVRNCDQMWCTSCHTPFSWITGNVIKTGTVHNPHYFQWLAKGGQQAPANPGFIPCGGLPNAYHVQSALSKAPKQDRKEILDILRICYHIMDVERHRFERHLDPLNNETIGVRYLMKESSEEEWKRELARKERDRQKSNEIRDILDAFNGAAIDLFRRVDTGTTYDAEGALTLINQLRIELEELRNFSFQAMGEVGKFFNCSVPWINEKWELVHGTERTRRLKDEKEKAAQEEKKVAAAAATAATAAAREVVTAAAFNAAPPQ